MLAEQFLDCPDDVDLLHASREEVDLLTPVFERWGSGPLFTAPHGVNVSRDGCADHLPEDFTTFLARTWAADTAGCSVVWSSAALALCAATEAPVPGARDPNYLLAAEAATAKAKSEEEARLAAEAAVQTDRREREGNNRVPRPPVAAA